MLGENELEWTEGEAIPERSVKQHMRETPKSKALFLSEALNFVDKAPISKLIMNLLDDLVDV